MSTYRMSSNDMTSASQNVLKLVKLSRQEFNNNTEAYAERVVNNMDTQTLEQLVFDIILDGLEDKSDNEVLQEVYDYDGSDDDSFREFCEDLVSDNNVNAFLAS